MKTKISSIGVSAEYRRKAIARRRHGKSASCIRCGETQPEALIRGSNPRICGRCQRRIQGKTEFDGHHVAGQNNHAAKVPVPINAHRARLSVAQFTWPSKTLRNPNKSPLLAVAACVRGFIDFFDYCIDEFLRPLPPILENIDSHLTERLGPHWWATSKSNKRSKR